MCFMSIYNERKKILKVSNVIKKPTMIKHKNKSSVKREHKNTQLPQNLKQKLSLFSVIFSFDFSLYPHLLVFS
jgi:hypothetical protein